jgi:hypothetical protein
MALALGPWAPHGPHVKHRELGIVGGVGVLDRAHGGPLNCCLGLVGVWLHLAPCTGREGKVHTSQHPGISRSAGAPPLQGTKDPLRKALRQTSREYSENNASTSLQPSSAGRPELTTQEHQRSSRYIIASTSPAFDPGPWQPRSSAEDDKASIFMPILGLDLRQNLSGLPSGPGERSSLCLSGPEAAVSVKSDSKSTQPNGHHTITVRSGPALPPQVLVLLHRGQDTPLDAPPRPHRSQRLSPQDRHIPPSLF